MTLVTELREAQRLPVLKHEGKATIVTDGVRGISLTEVAAVEVVYEIDCAQHHSMLHLRYRSPRKRNRSHVQQAGESVCVAVLLGHDYQSLDISSSTESFFSPAMFPDWSRESGIDHARRRNSILGFCHLRQEKLLAMEMFRLNFFESDYRDAQRRFSCGCERTKKNNPTGVDCLKAIFPDRWQLVETYQQQILSWRAPAAV
jgi:hypothetical protein